PHAEPEPTEWLQNHPDHIKLPATFVPRADSDGRANLSSGGPPPDQRRTVDGLAASPDPTAPRPPTGNAMFAATSAGTHEASDHTLIQADPIASYRRASDALASAASDYSSARAGTSDL